MKSQKYFKPGMFLFVMTIVVLECIIIGNAFSQSNDPYLNSEQQGIMSEGYGALQLPFDSNDYDFLIYESYSSENSIRQAMNQIGITNYTVCDSTNPITLNLLNSHDILIVGWDSSGNTSNKNGLIASYLEQGITGRVILSGHDSDYHTVQGPEAGETFFIQEIDYILKGNGTGLLVCADPQRYFDWLPQSWGVVCPQDNGGSIITLITDDGVDSGVYDGLTKEDMSGWGQTYHNSFTSWGDGFTVFELGENSEVVTIAAAVNPYGFEFWKEDDVFGECRNPEEDITYTICWDNISGQTYTDVWIIDYLPDGVTYPQGAWTVELEPNIVLIPPDPGYDAQTHSIVWDIDTLDPNDSNCINFTVTVNYNAEPGIALHNVAEIWSGDTFLARAWVDTPVCCWADEPNLIYVDQSASGANTGLTWQDAYIDLADALDRARYSICGDSFTIYVARGTYDPNHTSGRSFVLPENCKVYGGFKSGGCDFVNRNPKKYKTILTGMIDDDAFPDADRSVTMGDNTLLDGFTVIKGFENNIYGIGADFSIENCIIKDSYGYGIYGKDGDVAVKWCTVQNNDWFGIRHEGAGFTLSCDNSWILRNSEYGIYCEGSTPSVKNSIISESDLTKQGREGIRMIRPTYQPVLYNLTIANNKAAGIRFEDDGDITGDPNNKDWPDLQNSIVYYNNRGGRQLKGFDADNIANFCCIQDCNEVNTTNYRHEPGFAYRVDFNGTPDPNNYHLAYNAFCREKGSPYLTYTNQVDIDGEGVHRKYGTYVDIGADEVYSCEEPLSENDIWNPLDWNADGIVNLHEFNILSRGWLTADPNVYQVTDPNVSARWFTYGKRCDLSGDFKIDLDDLLLFCAEKNPKPDNYGWIACWKKNEIAQDMMLSGGGESMMAMSFGEPVMEYEEDVYADMSNNELALLVKGIYEIIDYLDLAIDENPETAENASDLKDFLESVLLDIKESFQ